MNSIKLPKGFLALVMAQSLGAFNDNLYKTLLQLYVLQIIVLPDPEPIIAQAVFVFTVPFIIFGPWAGYMADRFDKANLIRLIKLAEFGFMLLGMIAFIFGIVNLMLFVLFLLAIQSTFFAPAKAGLIPEICEAGVINKANSRIEAATLMAMIIGIAVTGALLSFHQNNALTVTYYGLGVAAIGVFSAFFVPISPQKHTKEINQPFPWNPITGIVRDITFLKQRRNLFLASLANGYFWLLGLIFSTNIMVYGKVHLGLNESENVLLSLLPACIGVGIASGAVLAGRWSGQKVELGLVPLGGLGITFAGIALYFSVTSYVVTIIILLLAGVCGGLFTIPLYAYLQIKAKETERGRVMATTGIINGLCLLLGSILYHLLAVELEWSPRSIFLLMGLIAAGVVVYICAIIPQFFVRFLGWLLIHTLYRIEIIGAEHVPESGPVLLTPNHVTYIDAFLISSTIQRFIRFVMIKSIYQVSVFKPFLQIMDVTPIAPSEGRESVGQSLKRAREQLQQGHVVCIFPEGKLTKSGEMNEFRPGFEAIMSGLDYPIIPVYMHNAWGSIFSFEGGKYFWKFPKQLPYPITIYYGQPLPANAKASEVAAAVQTLAEEAEARSKSGQAIHLPVYL